MFPQPRFRGVIAPSGVLMVLSTCPTCRLHPTGCTLGTIASSVELSRTKRDYSTVFLSWTLIDSLRSSC